jgi:site-specific DNA-cytosine methylase
MLTENNEEYEYALRKLTERECWRLMNFKDSDFEKAADVNSRTQLYKQAGNSIVVSVLMATFSQLNIKGVKCWNDMSETEKYELIYKACGKPRD